MDYNEFKYPWGIQRIYGPFDNGYGASITQEFPETCWELWVIRFLEWECKVCFDTPITDSTIKGLDQAGVDELLSKIRGLKNANTYIREI